MLVVLWIACVEDVTDKWIVSSVSRGTRCFTSIAMITTERKLGITAPRRHGITSMTAINMVIVRLLL